jgi:hypothetical protein
MLTHVVLPLAVFTVVIAGITIAANLVPREPAGQQATQKVQGDALIFPRKVVIWEPREPDYRPEYEKHTTGHCSFWFMNPSKDEAAELGFVKKACGCMSQVEFCLLEGERAGALSESRRFEERLGRTDQTGTTEAGALLPLLDGAAALPGPGGLSGILSLLNEGITGNDGLGGLLGKSLTWTSLSDEKNKDRAFVVPPGAVGLVRMSWETRTKENEQQTLTTDLWMQPKGNVGARRKVTLGTQVAFVPPVRSFPHKVVIQRWNDAGVGSGEFRCWSATRAHFPLEVEERSADPCVQLKVLPLSGTECRQLEEDLRKQDPPVPSRVLCGYRVRLTVRQEKGEHRLEQGRFQRWLTLRSKGVPDIAGVELAGTVYSDVVVGRDQDRGSINLGNFDVSRGKHQTVFIYGNKPGLELVLPADKARKYIIPELMKVELAKVDDGKSGALPRWELSVEVPAGAAAVGGWPRDGSITLQIIQPGKKSLIRIPVDANPYRQGS